MRNTKLHCQLLPGPSNFYDMKISVYLPSRLGDLTWSRTGNWRAMRCNW